MSPLLCFLENIFIISNNTLVPSLPISAFLYGPVWFYIFLFSTCCLLLKHFSFIFSHCSLLSFCCSFILCSSFSSLISFLFSISFYYALFIYFFLSCLFLFWLCALLFFPFRYFANFSAFAFTLKRSSSPLFAMAKIWRIGHDHQAPFFLFLFSGIKRWHKAKVSCHMINIPWNTKIFVDS